MKEVQSNQIIEVNKPKIILPRTPIQIDSSQRYQKAMNWLTIKKQKNIYTVKLIRKKLWTLKLEILIMNLYKYVVEVINS